MMMPPGFLAGEERGSGGRDSGDSLADIQCPAQGPAPDSVSGQLDDVSVLYPQERESLNILLLLIVSDIIGKCLFLVRASDRRGQ